MRSLIVGRTSNILNPTQFLEAYASSSEEDQNVMCELYQYDFILSHDRGWNPNPFVGDIELRYFASFIKNQLECITTLSQIEHDEA
jgi:hypothetical protein